MSGDALQFERAEYAVEAPAQVICSSCDQSVVQSYYELGGAIVCSGCRETRERELDGFGGIRFLRALGAGAGVGLAGAALWYGVRVVAEYELGLVAIAIGYGVGKAVSWGSRGKGGWLYQLLAMFLTYSAIVANYVPDVVQGALSDGGEPSLLLVLFAFVISYAVPFMMGAENIIGLLIIAFGLWEAWKFNQRSDAAMTGPYSVTAPLPAVPAPVPNV